MRRSLAWARLGLLVWSIGCGSGGRERGGAAAGAGTENPAHLGESPAGSVAAKPTCVLEGAWTECAVEDRLVHAGVVIERLTDPARHPFLRVEGVRYHVGSADHELQVFLYATEAERRADTEALDSATVSPRGARVTWPAPPTLVTSNNLAAVILSLNDRTVERLALALGAGLPQSTLR